MENTNKSKKTKPAENDLVNTPCNVCTENAKLTTHLRFDNMAKEIHATFVETTPRNHRCHNNSRKLVRRWQRPESTVMNVFSVEEVLCSLGMLEAAAKQLPGNYRAAAKQLLGNCGVAIAKQLARLLSPGQYWLSAFCFWFLPTPPHTHPAPPTPPHIMGS